MMWTPEQDAVIREHYRKIDARLIADMLDVSKDAVIGRANRLGLGVTLTEERARRRREKKIKWHRARDPHFVPERQTCKFPKGSKPFVFCGKPTTGSGKPYCSEHQALCTLKRVKAP